MKKVLSLAIIMLLSSTAEAMKIQELPKKAREDDMWETHERFKGPKKNPLDDLVKVAEGINPVGASSVGTKEDTPIKEAIKDLKKVEKKEKKKAKSADTIAAVKEEIEKEKKQSENDSDEKDDLEEDKKEAEKAVKKVEKRTEAVIKKVVQKKE
jgi:hypothetical protein